MTPTNQPHLRLANRPAADQRAALCDIVATSPVLTRTLDLARHLALPDCWLVAGAIYNQVWNHLTGRPEMYGVNDIDLIYFDPDTRWQAEDAAIRRAVALFPATPRVELRNQARVHLWFEERFGQPYPPLASSRESVDRFASRTHAVALRLSDSGALDIYAPYGLNDIFAFRLVPNPLLDNRETHELKAKRQMALWPELTFVPWPD